MTTDTWKTIGIVVAIVVAINVGSYFMTRRAFAATPTLAANDGGPTR